MAEGEKKIQQYKIEMVKELKDKFKSTKDYIFTNYRGLNVEQITDLRRKLREKNAEYRIIKNRFARIAMEQLELPDVGDQLRDPTAVALSRDDEVNEVVKILSGFKKETSLQIKGALIGGRIYNGTEVEAFSRLPSKQELIAKLAVTMNAPLQNLVFVLNGVTSKLVRTIQAIADRKAGDKEK
ncbi:MAG: 50S ribosomal protein L10 [Spirochaetes bacterium]|nr:MAG: 50S ribosomal protein L10 [Spirochaetota bacterium]